tara:strand:- start:3885 stop:5261 length:1377 start_codon:yes stop_codon:yes gene_type:complete
MGWFSGSDNSKDVKKQWEYDKDVWRYDWDSMQLTHDHAKSAYTAQKATNASIRDAEYATKINAWKDAAVIREFDFANQRKAHNASIEAFNKQLDYNELAEEIALDDNKRKYNDRMTEIGYQNEELLMNHDFTEELKATELKHALESGQVKTTRLAKGIDDAVKDAGYTTRQLNNQLLAARQDAARKGVDLTLDSLKKQGAILASGQTGRSARKNLQSVLSEHGRGQKAITDMLTNEELGHTLNMEMMANKLQSLKSDTSISYTDLATQLAHTSEATALNIKQSKDKTGFGQRQLKDTLKSAEGQFNADKKALALQRYSADMAAEANIAPKAQMAPAPSMPIKAPAPYTQPPQKPPRWNEYAKTRPIKGVITKQPGILSQFFSDDRLKYDINRVGTSKKGIPIYTFKYRFNGKHGPKYKGTSAQDLLNTKFKDAVSQTEKNGFLYVDYSKIDVEFEKVT